MAILSWLPVYQNRVNNSILRYFAKNNISSSQGLESDFILALRHAVEGGGKRLRPILSMLAYEQISGQECSDEVLDGLIGIELLHCYTLVHDDLPCMDNDILRRGKPTVWKQYGETMAILVGDALQTMAFEQLATLGDIRVITEIAHTTGDTGVVLGQVRDTLGDQGGFSLADIMRIHDEKTGGFIASCLIIGGMISGANREQLDVFRKFGILLGRAFQVRDDILDHEGESATLGKTVGKDQNQKKGLVTMFGIGETKKILEEIGVQMDIILQDLENQKFIEIKQYVMERKS
ncbi:polyprenyl synthetase family protein [Candidatus Gracilibacteria bacterium]|nr:polyprenyl synthetase family protein [Candidatus Gracilibacteria bacterium]